MKKILLIASIATAFFANAQTHKLEKIWETDTIVAVPESVLPDLKQNILYVSLIDGGGWDKDGKGGVAKISTQGKNYNGAWITGLNAPKGLGMYNNKLYAADISEVAVIDTKKGAVGKRIAIEGASGLNDITVSNKGIVYVSDSRTGRVWKIENDQPSLYLENINGVNGLKAVGDDLYIGGGQNFLKADKNKNLTTIAKLPQGIDGIEPIGNGDFILTAWAGYIFYVSASGSVETLLETYKDKSNTADIGYDAKTKTVFVPTFNAKKVVAYKLK